MLREAAENVGSSPSRWVELDGRQYHFRVVDGPVSVPESPPRNRMLVVSQPRNSSCFRRDLDKQEIAIARLLPKNTFDFKHD